MAQQLSKCSLTLAGPVFHIVSSFISNSLDTCIHVSMKFRHTIFLINLAMQKSHYINLKKPKQQHYIQNENNMAGSKRCVI